MIAIVDAGLGNLRSVVRAVEATGTNEAVRLARVAQDVQDATHVIVPGQGAFGEMARSLKDNSLGSAITNSIKSGKPYLGICLGMQILFDHSEESAGEVGLRLLPGAVKRLSSKEKVPSTGWRQILRGDVHIWAHFSHSYHVIPDDKSMIISTYKHGDDTIAAAIAYENVVGVQFHPEKSQVAGIALLRDFVNWKS